MNFKQYILSLNETFGIPTDKPILIILTGGIASGKSTAYKQYFSEMPILDIDLLTKGDFSKQTKKSIILQNKTEKEISGKNSLVYTKTGAFPEKILLNIRLAKQKGMKTAVIFVDTPLKQALQNNIDRTNNGDWHLIPENDIIKTNKLSKENFKIYI